MLKYYLTQPGLVPGFFFSIKMNLVGISKFLEVACTGVAYKIANDLRLKIQKCSYSDQTFSPEEIKQLAEAYKHVEQQYSVSCNTIVTLADENRRLQVENEFMLKLVNSHMKQ